MKIFVQVKTQAKQNSIIQVSEGHYRVAVKEAARDGKANEAVCKIVSQHFKVARSLVRVVTGTRGKKKIIDVKTSP